MNCFNYIKRKLPFYLVSGVILALALSSLMVIHRYNDHLDNTLTGIRDTSLKRDLLEKEIEKTDALIRYIRDDLDVDMTQANSERQMFRALDDMKARLKGASITVPQIDGKGKPNELPFELEAGMKSYSMLLEYAAYLESFSIPDLEIRHVFVTKGETGGVVLKIEGALVVPSTDTET